MCCDRRLPGLVLGIGLALAGAGCTPEVCSRTTDCATGLVCTILGKCEIPADASLDGAGLDGGGGTGDGPATIIDARETPIGDAAVRDAATDAIVAPTDADDEGL